MENSEKFSVWKTITIGDKSKRQLLDELRKCVFYLFDWVKDAVNKLALIVGKSVEISLVRVKVGELGFTEKPTTDELFARIKEVGTLCPAEIGPYLALLFDGQPVDDYCWVLSEPIIDSDEPQVFFVEKSSGGEVSLDMDYAGPERLWRLDYEIVFVAK